MSRWLSSALTNSLASWTSAAPEQKEDISVKTLMIFPVKSCKGIQVESAEVTPSGLRYDREFMLVEEESHRFLTARTIPKMILIGTSIDFERQLLTITIPATDETPSSAHTISLARPDPSTFPAEDHHPDFTLWGSHVDGYSVGTRELREALSAYMGRPVLLVQRGEELREASSTGFVQGLPGASFDYTHHPSVSYADEYPILLCSQDSIAELDRRVINDKEVQQKFAKQFDAVKWKNGGVQPVQFRGNILVEGTKGAWEEDCWAEVIIGEEREDAVPLIVAQRCARCQLPNVDPATSIRDPVVPDKMMERDRHNFPALKEKLTFGMQTVPKCTSGKIHVGDKVRVVRRYTDKRPDGTVIRFEDLPFEIPAE
ncbi:MOSC N-terminal beta barrel domain-domain-containing protein [Leucosporidium creatinivorum]|uniref:MOSC N-terminal beta barrel domain-domain-containing protein n=1 Tax=Leucosporidium creatinivorum TaxID=106004 RepID=A0A1Y2FI24_9BASI|nr:MOSC N-terminal beta barrel domain-domain-containing protein [Leucosporidium creatinivorum]